jgi:hypothetical protein
MNDEGMLKPALIGGVLLGILSVMPYIQSLNCCCCAWVIGGGLLAAYLYVKGSSTPVTLGRGVKLGLITGSIGGLVDFLFSIPLDYLMKSNNVNAKEQLLQLMERWFNVTPELREYIQNVPTPSDTGLFTIILKLIFTIGIFCLFAMLGGTIGVALFEKRKTGAPPDNFMPNPPPTEFPPPPPPDIP